MGDTKERPDSTMDESVKKQLKAIITYKKKDTGVDYSSLTGFTWSNYEYWPNLGHIKGYKKGILFLVKNATGYWWMREEGNQKNIRPPTAKGFPDNDRKSKAEKLKTFWVASFREHVVQLNKSVPIGLSVEEVLEEARQQQQRLIIDMVGGKTQTTTPVAPTRGNIYVASKKTLDGKKIVIVWCWAIRSGTTSTFTKYISYFLPQLVSDEELPKNLAPGGRKWTDAAATITLLPEGDPTAFDVGELVLGPRGGGGNLYRNGARSGGSKPDKDHNNQISWQNPNVTTAELLKSFNEYRFQVMETDNKSTKDILLMTKLRLERLISIGIAFKRTQLTSGAAPAIPAALRSTTGFMRAETNFDPVLKNPLMVHNDENVNDAVRFTELLECVDDICKVVSHRTGALVSEMETTHLEENKIDKILWVCCNSCKKGSDRGSCQITSRKPFLHTWYIIMAAGIAAAGLGTNSAPVVVASMLVSSMMEPIKGMATAARCQGTDKSKCSRNTGRFFAHFVLLMCDVGLCLFVGYIAGWIFSISSEDWNEYTLTEQLSGTVGISQRTRSIKLPQEIYGRGEVSGLVVAVVVALFSTFALITADKSDNKSALVGIGISASLLPPVVNAGLLFGMHDRGYVAYIGTSKSEPNLQKRGGISFALAFINIGIIICTWTLGFLCLRYSNKERCCHKKTKAAVAIEMFENPLSEEYEENTPLLRF